MRVEVFVRIRLVGTDSAMVHLSKREMEQRGGKMESRREREDGERKRGRNTEGAGVMNGEEALQSGTLHSHDCTVHCVFQYILISGQAWQ